MIYIFQKLIQECIDTSINLRTGSSKLFNKIELENFKISNANDLLLFFVPNFSMRTPLSYMLFNNYFDLFNNFYPGIVKYFSDFVSNKHFIEKIICMFTYIFQNKRKYPKSSIKEYYCSLGFDVNYFDDESESQILEKVIIIQGYLKKVEQEIWKNSEFSSLDFILE